MPTKIDKIKYQIHKASGTLEKYRGNLVGSLIYEKYDVNDQIGIAMDIVTKPEKVAKYQAYRSECIATVDKWFLEMEAEIQKEKESGNKTNTSTR